MNRAHREFLASPEWAAMLETNLVPWVESVGDLGDDVLEVGPGPGLTTDVLRQRAARLTAVELDEDLATALADRLAGTNVRVIHGDGTDTGLDPDLFSAATCFSVLHHLPSGQVQDLVLTELHRVLRPGGLLLVSDSLDLEPIRKFHTDDTFVPLDPDSVAHRLQAAGFVSPTVEQGEYELRVHARKG